MNKANLVTCAFWVGQEKPSMSLLLKPLKQLLSRLRSTGITVSTPSQQLRRMKLQPLFGVLDLIAKAPVLNMVQFNGANGCPSVFILVSGIALDLELNTLYGQIQA